MHKTTRFLLVLLAAGGLSGCDVLGIGGDDEVSVSFAVPRGGNTARAALLADTTITDGTNRIVVQSVELTVSEVTLERDEDQAGGDSDGDSEVDSDSDGPSNRKLRTGPTTLALPVDGGVITPIRGAVPAGTYEKVELDVEFARLRGTYNGQPFDVTVQVNRELELEFNPPLKVDGDLNVTIKIEVLSWFRGTDGRLIDPRALNTNSTLRSNFVRRIEASFKAFEDSDRDADEVDSDSDSR